MCASALQLFFCLAVEGYLGEETIIGIRVYGTKEYSTWYTLLTCGGLQ